MNKLTIYIFILISLTLYMCSGKDRSNPLDPRNPDSAGKITGVRIHSEFDSVVLSWRKVYVDDLLSYNIYRRLNADTSFKLVQKMDKDSSRFTDANLEYGKKYIYRVSAETDYFETPLSDSVSITPGPSVVWICDVDMGRIKWLSDDIIHSIDQKSIDGYPWDLEITGSDRTIYYSDILWGYVVRIDDTWKTYSSEDGYWDPVDIDFDKYRNLLWVVDQNGAIIQINTVFYDSLSIIQHQDFLRPRSIHVDDYSGIGWIADPDAKSLFRVSPYRGTVVKLNESFICPMNVVMNNHDGSIWVADSSRIVRLGTNEQIELVIEDNFNYLLALDIDIEKQKVWAIDISMDNSKSRLFKFDYFGNREFVIEDFDFPRNLRVNQIDHSCIVLDSGAGKVIKILENGDIYG